MSTDLKGELASLKIDRNRKAAQPLALAPAALRARRPGAGRALRPAGPPGPGRPRGGDRRRRGPRRDAEPAAGHPDPHRLRLRGGPPQGRGLGQDPGPPVLARGRGGQRGARGPGDRPPREQRLRGLGGAGARPRSSAPRPTSAESQRQLRRGREAGPGQACSRTDQRDATRLAGEDRRGRSSRRPRPTSPSPRPSSPTPRSAPPSAGSW